MDDPSSSGESHTKDNQRSGQPSEAERQALLDSGPLLRFACENIDNLDKDLPLAIAEARQACVDGTWSIAVSQRFWLAFNALCSVIRPVTIDCLNALHRDVPRKLLIKRWRPPMQESLAERSSRRYTSGLLWMLGVIVVLQLMSWTYTNLSDALVKKAVPLQTAATTLRSQCDALAPKTGSLPGESVHVFSRDELSLINQFELDGAAVSQNALGLTVSSRILAFVSMTSIADRFGEKGQLEPSPNASMDYVSKCHLNVENGIKASNFATVTSERARVAGGILQQFVLPVLLGTIGALAYVLRSTSEQIRSKTFSTVSPVRNLVRIVLGALMGVVIGLFTDLSGKANLQPLAIAFLAGYGVEPVFSLFDGLIARLK
jgi:hypothetical protein